MILLLAQNSLQERTLAMTLKLGGHSAYVIRDELEAINMIKTVPQNIRGLVLGGAGCRQTLTERISVLVNNQIRTPIYLVGLTGGEVGIVKDKGGVEPALQISMCSNDELLECLNGKDGGRQRMSGIPEMLI